MPGLEAIVAALGGDLWDGGRRANTPAPGHRPRDRSVSLRLEGDRLLIHTFGQGDWRTVRDDLVRRGLLTADGRLVAAGPGAEAPVLSRRERLRAAERLWGELAPLQPGDLGARHLGRRAIAADLARSPALRFGRAPLRVYRDDGRRRPALAAAVRFDSRLTGLELTYLAPDGGRARDLRLPRKTVGLLPAGCAVELAAPARAMLVGEGVFTTLSAMARFDRPGWALLAAHNLGRWRPPAGVVDVLIAADPGRTGEAAADRLARRLAAQGVRTRIVLPPAGLEDWNALAVPEGEGRAGRDAGEGGDGPRPPAGETP